MTEDQGGVAGVVIERGAIYEHESHGQVEVLGIWKGFQRVDETGTIGETEGPMIVCYTICEDDQPVGELSDTLESFLSAIDSTD